MDITWLLAAVSLNGSFFNAKKKIICFYIWALGEICWMILDISGGVFGRAFLDLTQLSFSLYVAYEWRKDENKNKNF